MICEQCGNEFFNKHIIYNEDGQKRYKCPFCKYQNEKFVYEKKRKKKKKR